MAAGSNLPRNRVNILERFNDTELLNYCWEALADRALTEEPPPNKCSDYFLLEITCQYNL